MAVFIEDPSSSTMQTQGPLIISTATAMIVVTTVSVGLRFLSRIVTKVPLLLDDWLILAALPFAIATSAISLWGAVYHHFGTHIWDTATVDTLHNFLRGLFVFEITYSFSIALAKFSMLAIYWRIFPGSHIKWPLIVTACITGAWLIASAIVAIFTCNPIQGFWLFETEPTCINSLSYFLGSAGSNITLDVIMLLIPITTVMRLKITMSQRFAVCGIFGLGVFVTVCSCLRLNQLVIASNEGLDTDPTWDLVGSGLWSDIETTASIVCACLPTMRPLLRLIMHGTVREASRLSRLSRLSYNFSTPRSSMRSSTTHNLFGGHHKNTLSTSTYQDSLERTLGRPLSGVEGANDDWLGKGVGLPRAQHIIELELGVAKPPSPTFPMSPPPAAYLGDRNRASNMSIVPPLPSRSPFRNQMQMHIAQQHKTPHWRESLPPMRHVPRLSWSGTSTTASQDAPDASDTTLLLSRSRSERLGSKATAYDDIDFSMWSSRRPSEMTDLTEVPPLNVRPSRRSKPLPWTPLQIGDAEADSIHELDASEGYRPTSPYGELSPYGAMSSYDYNTVEVPITLSPIVVSPMSSNGYEGHNTPVSAFSLANSRRSGFTTSTSASSRSGSRAATSAKVAAPTSVPSVVPRAMPTAMPPAIPPTMPPTKSTSKDKSSAPTAPQTRRLVRDPVTGKYVLSRPPSAAEEHRISDWSGDWEAELDRGVDIAWASRLASRAISRAQSECGSLYEWHEVKERAATKEGGAGAAS